MRLSGKAIAACALLSISPLSHAEPYLGIAGAASEYSGYNNVNHGFGFNGFGGYRFESIPLMVEAGYLDTGTNTADDFYGFGTPAKFSFKGEQFFLGYFGRVGRQGSGWYAKAGYFTGKNREKTMDLSANDNGFAWGAGFDWMFTRNLGLRGEFGGLVGVHDFSTSDHKSNVTVLGLGLVFAFGGPELPGARGRSRPAPVYSPPVPAPVYNSPVPTPVYSPAVAPEPVAASPAPVVAAAAPVAAQPVVAPTPAPATSSATAGSAQLVPGAVLRSGPSMKSAGIRTMTDGGSVKLIKRETNAEGPWWMVQLDDGTTGWMIEWGLTRISKH